MTRSFLQSSAHTLGFCLVTGTALTLYALGKTVGIGLKERKKTKEELSIQKNDERPKVVVISGCDTGFGQLMAQAWTTNKKIIVRCVLTKNHPFDVFF